MKYYYTEEQAIYMQQYQGEFNRKLAEWAVSKMQTATGSVVAHPLEEVLDILRANNARVSEKSIYTAWYLYHMALADYARTLSTDKLRASYVDETLNDPDGCQGDVLACFEAKMQNAGEPIFWEQFL